MSTIRNAVIGVIFVAGATYAAAANPEGVITTTTPQGRTVVVTPLNDRIVRVTNAAKGERPTRTQAAVLHKAPFAGKVYDNEGTRSIVLPSGLHVELDSNSGAVTFAAPDGKTLLSDNASRVDGTLVLAPARGESEAFYGAGERGYHLKLNGDTLVMYNRQNYGYTGDEPRLSQMNISIPLMVSDRGYGVLFDDFAPARLIMADPVIYESENPDPVSYFFIYGDSTLAGVTSQYVALTGHQDLPPFWALGYITSKYGYKTEAEARGVIDTLRTEGYPVDGMVLDLYWYGKETDMGRLEWDTVQWPDYRDMLADLKADGVNVVTISQPYVNKIGAIDNYRMAAEKGLLARDSLGRVHDVTTWVGDAGMWDVSNPDTRRWLRERYRELTDSGIGGWWGDLGEPEVHPESIVHHNGLSARQYHNVYGNDWSRIIYDLYREEFPDTRLMTLMRGGTAGLQRYSVYPWSTDVSRTWGGLEPQIRIMLNSGMSGLGYMSHDVGGFAITDSTRVTDPELYVRWLQLGLFSPILRTHAQQVPEPYRYPEQKDIILPLIRERYAWLPYNYTLAYENAAEGLPMVRPLNFYGGADARFDNVGDQYLWGADVMVAPVLSQGARERRVIIPSGIWIDYNDPRKAYAGPDTIMYKAPLDVIPLFVREGAFLPRTDGQMRNVGDYDPAHYSVLYYPRGKQGESDFAMYTDDRRSTRSLAEGSYAMINFHGDVTLGCIAVDITVDGYYEGMPESVAIDLQLPGMAPSDFTSFTVDGREMPLNPRSLNLDIPVEVSIDKPARVVLTR